MLIFLSKQEKLLLNKIHILLFFGQIQAPKKKKTIKHKDISSHIEVFDLNNLDDIHVEEYSFLFEQGETISEQIDNIYKALKEHKIPMDAKILEQEDNRITVSFTRKETLKERTERLYKLPIIEEIENQKELKKALKAYNEKIEEIEIIKAKIEKHTAKTSN